ncbi:MAG TPA: glutathione S-transferase family protein [Methyloceanibacter sp.]|nr:glutathione S-transferase family protein [Methyloceanibacter sp.]
MITLYGFGPAFGLPDPSPFVMKAEILLKMAGVAYTVDTGGFNKAPKGKLPYIVDDGEPIGDSTFIRWHLEKKYNIDFDRGLNAEQRAEDNLYWAVVHDRWLDENNFAKEPRNFFRAVPAPIRPLVIAFIRRRVRSTLHLQGMGRHSRQEVAALASRSIDATADFLGTKAYMMGAEPTGVDATSFAFVAGVLCPVFETPVRAAAERHDNLRGYADRMMARFYPGLGLPAGRQTAA